MDSTAKVVVGLCVLGVSAGMQLLCLLLMRVLVKLKHGGHISTMRTWLYLSSTLEQLSFIMFHVKYNFFDTDFKIPDTCIVLRFIVSFCSTFTTMWMLVISSFYLVLTIKPEKCFTLHSRFLSHCVTWCWTCVSCLLYIVLAFLINERQHIEYVASCWTKISGTIHLFNTYGNEIIPLVVALIFIACGRYRISTRQMQLERFMKNSEFNVNVTGLFRAIDRYLILLSIMVIYYSALTFRFLLDDRGSDMLLMIFQASRGIGIAVLTCLCDEDVSALIRDRRHRHAGHFTSNGRVKKGDNVEMNTYIFHENGING